MKKRTLAALIAAPVAIAGVWTAVAANDNNATDAAAYAATHPVVAPTPAPTVTTTKTVTAARNLDLDAMDTYTAKLTALAPTYNANKAACRAAGSN